ncbi:MAG: tRNA (adenosine(37)-N6)-threonylcarbamoyltransferase complex dimerization subunit type 1 TsaB [Deltaproteobacteria bacterium]|nr:tRNA (adenosine(37)-N6)-threonylcarbamoyltransferase complex dimerization subunit type 1 TsaB [Deltaproteobacteria bacterium]MBI3078530.1 tRNA (adenosine(37)-N6)-threonylcarbamoyltransferase complex dimerization subunit type 1 TsaB [Deltaproteobacteria bacterium]
MRVLAVETATSAGSVALVEKGEVVAELFLRTEAAHAERLLPAIDRVLGLAGASPHSLDGLAVGVGPGSFTGLRIGISTVKGLAWSLGRPVVGIPTLEALACNALTSPLLLCPMLDARKAEVYAALYRVRRGPGDNGLQELRGVRVLPPRAVAAEITEPTLFLGTGARLYREFLTETLGDLARFAPSGLDHPRAAVVGGLAEEAFQAGRGVSPETLGPLYVRSSEAELKYGPPGPAPGWSTGPGSARSPQGA